MTTNFSEKTESFSPELMRFLADVIESGGKPLLVGGWVRDYLLGLRSKDLDFEVFNIPLSRLKRICRSHGRLYTVGAAFAVLKLTLADGETIDVSIPRKDFQIGEGHRGFEIHADPFMSIEEAAQRRDLTVNAISMDPLTLTPVDPTNGVTDLNNRTLRHVGERFSEDPLRVLRVYQFQARLGFRIAPETRHLCRDIAESGMLLTLPRERIEEEMRKLCLRGHQPSILTALRNAREDGVIKALFPELYRLSDVKQDPRHHAEGDALEHTFRAVSHAAEIAQRDELDEMDAWTLCLATLIHDLGKAEVSRKLEDGSIISHGHDKAGQEAGKSMLERLTGQIKIIQQALILARMHMRPLMLAQAEKVGDGAIRRLAQAVRPSNIEMLCRLTEADTLGSIRGDGTEPRNAHAFLRNRARNIGVEHRPPTPIIQGRDLIKLAKTGVIPEQYSRGGPHFGPLLNQLYDAQLDGKIATAEEAIVRLKNLISTS